MEKIYKKEIQRLMPLFQAIAEGKTIQWNDMGLWRDIDGDDEGFFLDTFVGNTVGYRIKPEPKYRPFKNTEECWQEMQKHEPFGWVKRFGNYTEIITLDNNTITLSNSIGKVSFLSYKDYKQITFSDGTPFGILEEG